MNCPKCGCEIVNGRCSQCGYIQHVNITPTQTIESNLDTSNEKIILILGILSFFIPILAIVVLIIAKDYKKTNNYGGSSNIKIGKICAITSLILIIVFVVLVLLAMIIVASSNVSLINKVVDSSDTMYKF